MSEFSQGTSLLASTSLEIDYEALSPNHKLWVHLAAGSIAGVVEHCVMFPLDSFKTRVQSLCPCPEASCSTPIHGVFSIIKKEGWLRPLRGVNAVALGSVPAHALYFSVYEKMKNFLTGNRHGHFNTLSYGIAGASATIVHDLVMNPVEVVKQRMQMIYSPYCSSIECIKCIYHIEGFQAFYRSYATQLAINIPFQSIHFMTYEFFQQMLNFDRSYNPKVHLLAGAMAGGLAAAITTPLDCIKTVLNTQQNSIINIDARNNLSIKAKNTYLGFFDAVYSIYNNRGFNGFARGIQARIMYQMPAAALSWSVYELFKFIFSDKEVSLRIF